MIESLSEAREAGRMLNDLEHDMHALRMMIERYKRPLVEFPEANELWLYLQDVMTAAETLDRSLNKALDHYAEESAPDHRRSDLAAYHRSVL